jgi:DNA-directed RNA polymerase specialized sigma24 family protein
MILVNFRGLSYDEAAECMRIKTHSVRRLLERSVEYLLERLKAEQESRQQGSQRSER